MSISTNNVAVGAVVGASRWPYSTSHHGLWQKPWKGVVLDVRDPRAWEGTIAFGARTPAASEIEAHINRTGPVTGVPVLWDFGSFQCVHWERPESVRSYEEDLFYWQLAYQEAVDRGS